MGSPWKGRKSGWGKQCSANWEHRDLRNQLSGCPKSYRNQKGKFELISNRTPGPNSLCLAWKVYCKPRSQYCSQEYCLPKELLSLILPPCPWRGYQRSLERHQCCGCALCISSEESYPGPESSETIIFWKKSYKMGVVAEFIYDLMSS